MTGHPGRDNSLNHPFPCFVPHLPHGFWFCAAMRSIRLLLEQRPSPPRSTYSKLMVYGPFSNKPHNGQWTDHAETHIFGHYKIKCISFLLILVLNLCRCPVATHHFCLGLRTHTHGHNTYRPCKIHLQKSTANHRSK